MFEILAGRRGKRVIARRRRLERRVHGGARQEEIMTRTRMLALASTLVAIGCAHKQQDKAQAPTQPVAQAPAPTPPPATPSNSCSRDLDCKDGQLCIRNACVDITPGLAECNNVRVHFAFNSAEIDETDKPGLDRAARCLKAETAMHVTVAGNADERGTEEYNLALGDRRAHTVAEYLKALGASDAQLKTISYGKEQPLCTDHDEACWARNRRADLAVATTAGKKHKRHHAQ
jgi:peptidoglycan-associated lipoprotein